MYRRDALLTNLENLAHALDLKDPYTAMHSQRVSWYAVRLVGAMSLPEDEVERIRIGGLMHDIGIIGVPDHIIHKPGKQFTPQEQAKMRQHAAVGAEIIKPLAILGVAEMVRHHHENHDGSGYPDGLKGKEIPLGSRVIAVADAFDDLVTDRPCQKAVALEEALAVIREHAGTQFDWMVVDALERIANPL